MDRLTLRLWRSELHLRLPWSRFSVLPILSAVYASREGNCCRSDERVPTDTLAYASADLSRCQPQDSGPRWIRFLLSIRTLSIPTMCRRTTQNAQTADTDGFNE